MSETRKQLSFEIQELTEIHARFRTIFVLTNILVVLVVVYLIAEVFSAEIAEKTHQYGVALIAGALVLLCAAQFYCLRLTANKSRRKIEALTFIDELTQVHNYRYIDRRIAQEINRCKRSGLPLSILYVDLDNFKEVNDTHGHIAGNNVLAQVGALLKITSRRADMIGRLGGDEFLILLPEVNRDEAQIFAERIRKRFAEHVFRLKDGQEVDSLRLSIGVATMPADGTDKETLITAADRAMYRAKQAGGDRVCI